MDTRHLSEQLINLAPGQAFCISRRTVDQLFVPDKVDYFTEFALMMGGHRPVSTQADLIRMFADDCRCDYHFDWRGDLHFRLRKKAIDTPEQKHVIL